MKKNELSYKELKEICNPNIFKFENTSELDGTDVVFGQDRGIKALEFGLAVDSKGYNLFIEGPSGVGKTMYARKAVAEVAKKRTAPDDWCYIYNFDNPNEPLAVSLPAGNGKAFKENMDNFINDIRKDIKLTFNNEDFEKEKTLIKQKYDEKKNQILEKLNSQSMKHGFQVKTTANGIYMMPVIDGKAIEEEEFDKLDNSIKQAFEEKSTLVQDQIFEVIGQIKSIERETDKKVNEWQSNIALLTINSTLNSIKSIYKKNVKISNFLENIKNDILKNINLFIKEEPHDIKQPGRQELKEPWLNYRVNLFIDNSHLTGAPVIMDSNYIYHNLFGKLEYENQYGMLKTDYTMLKPGLLHRANGGYIILQAADLLANQVCYDTLKKALMIKELNIENNMDQRSGYMVMISLKPQPIPINVKVLLLGNSNIYHTLLALDPDFKKLFKVKVEFEDSAPRTDTNILRLAKFVNNYCIKENLLPLDKEAVSKIVEYTSKLADDKNKLSTRFGDIGEIISEAATWAKLSKKKIVSRDLVDKALKERIERVKKYDSKYLEMIEENTLLISTSGKEIGSINGLTVMTIGDYTFGKPSKITANTYLGKDGFINIEREVELSGPSHSKGVLILEGYIGETFAQNITLSMNVSICFEQLYNGVDGDSASSTEVYAILSSLSEIPINQAIAVTGSINQKGLIQPIGGANEKIEGFYQICKSRGLTGEHGVIIPIQNVKNLSLSDELIEDVKKGNFHIYAVSTLDEGIEILTGVPAGKKNKDGKFPAGTINYLVYEKLKKYAQLSKNRITI